MLIRKIPVLALGLVGVLTAGTAVAGDLSFSHVMNIGTEGNGPGQFKYVEDFAFTADGKLLATDASHAFIQVFDKKTGAFLTRFGGRGDGDANFEKPEGIAVDKDGFIYIADYATGYLKKFDKDFQWVATFSEYGTGPGQNIKSEFISILGDRLFLPEVGSNRVDVFDLNGNFLFMFGGPGTATGQFNTPESAKVNSEGKLYVADLKNDRIQVFDKDGKYLFHWGVSGSAPGELKSPAGVSFDAKDNVYVSEIGNDRIQVFDKTGKYLTHWGKKGAGNGEFGNLHGLIVDRETGWVYVADSANNRIQVFRPTPGA